MRFFLYPSGVAGHEASLPRVPLRSTLGYDPAPLRGLKARGAGLPTTLLAGPLADYSPFPLTQMGELQPICLSRSACLTLT